MEKLSKAIYFTFISLILFLSSCENIDKKEELNYYSASSNFFSYEGRFEALNDSVNVLISAASSVKSVVMGDSVSIMVEGSGNASNYIVLTLDSNYLGRFLVDKKPIIIKLPDPDQFYKLEIYKATEAVSGNVFFKGLMAENLQEPAPAKQVTIEFIGNSITCGMGADTKEIPCDTKYWTDQHNAYLAYGPRVARALNVNYKLSCVSGIGIYRNWNDEDQPVMPDVYKNLYFNQDSTKKIAFEHAPEIVSIALGTNDFSIGDGVKDRSEFDKGKFIQAYTAFVEEISKIYPTTKIVLLDSPMLGLEMKELLNNCLNTVKDNFPDKEITVLNFEPISPAGCTGHPDIDDHEAMANQLLPIYKQLLKN